MKALAAAVLLLVGFFAVSQAQKSNDEIQKQIKSLHAEKSIFLTYDGNASKLMAVASNFEDSETKAAGIQAMNFAMAVFYQGQQITDPPDTINFTFWPMSKKPRFATTGAWVVDLPSGPLSLGDYRYAAKPSENMEYLNFKIKRDDLAKIAASTLPVKFHLAGQNFTFIPEQLQLLRNFLAVSDSK
jgi:hypothetical protein